MEFGYYVNSPAEERRSREELRQNQLSGQNVSGGSKIVRFVGVSFGLLCILQTALNVSFRLQAVGCSNRCSNTSTGNFTKMSGGDIGDVILERDQLVQEKDNLVQEYGQLVQQKDNLVQEKGQLVQEKGKLDREKGKLDREKKGLIREKNQLSQDKANLLQEKDQLAKENEELQANNSRLIEEKNTLNEKVIIQENQIKALMEQEEASQCPVGWQTYMSSCYQISSTMGSWEYARQNCARKRSHLVILNDRTEERIVRRFGAVGKMWIGLSGRRDTLSDLWTWTYVDGSVPSFENWNYRNRAVWMNFSYGCASIDSSSSSWFLDTCHEQFYWMCEKELRTSSFLPK